METAISNTTIPDFFPQISPRKRKLKRKASGKLISRQLNEVIYGNRPFLQVYSSALQHSICFVNEGLINPNEMDFDGKIITMEMLAEIMTNENEFPHVMQGMLSE